MDNGLLGLLPDEERAAYRYMEGFLNSLISGKQKDDEIKNLIIYLNEKDRRRKTNWRQTFPWLIKYEALCGIQK